MKKQEFLERLSSLMKKAKDTSHESSDEADEFFIVASLETAKLMQFYEGVKEIKDLPNKLKKL